MDKDKISQTGKSKYEIALAIARDFDLKNLSLKIANAPEGDTEYNVQNQEQLDKALDFYLERFGNILTKLG